MKRSEVLRLGATASEFGISPWQYLTGEPPGSMLGAYFDSCVALALIKARAQKKR
jgi:hypothetical protein